MNPTKINNFDTFEFGLSFDDVLLKPNYSEVLPNSVDISTKLTKKLRINLPIISAAMDSVTEFKLAIAMAQFEKQKESGLIFLLICELQVNIYSEFND